ncbi:hypothetical protein GCM10011391_24770 [Pullulanibacillus camelliae]|uniref:Uncharacterized protein n=1 Tax=Pullulanibacillus camelliae TaxID=1707096 RepID=A0A8J3DVI7_9BACL|nr:hypothetical protein [Pullulanibacillus camelliae]GGE44964.1 hypothetical protein GCM10011391_24770 [Pullulanibacillus camelliae]
MDRGWASEFFSGVPLVEQALTVNNKMKITMRSLFLNKKVLPRMIGYALNLNNIFKGFYFSLTIDRAKLKESISITYDCQRL